MAGFLDNILKGLGGAARKVDDWLAPDTQGGKNTFSGNLRQIAQNPQPTLSWLNDKSAPDFGGQKRTFTSNYQDVSRSIGTPVMNSNIGRNYVVPTLTGLSRIPMGVASLVNPQAGAWYNQTRDAVTNNATTSINVPLIGKINPFMLAGDIAGDPTSYIPVAKGLSLGGKALRMGALGASSGFLTPAATMQDRLLNTGLGSTAGALPLAGKAAGPAARVAIKGAGKGGKVAIKGLTELGDKTLTATDPKTFKPQSFAQSLNHLTQKYNQRAIDGLRAQVASASQGDKLALKTIRDVISHEFGGLINRLNDKDAIVVARAYLTGKDTGKAAKLLNRASGQTGSIDTDLLTGGLASKKNPIVNPQTGQRLNEALGDLREKGWSESDIERYRKAVLGASKPKPTSTSQQPSYGMNHRPSQSGRSFDISESQAIPADFYNNPHWYADMSQPTYRESFAALQKIRNKPDAEVTIYRASPKNQLNHGDWVTLSKSYAKQESLTEKTPVHSFKVKARDIQFAGDDINEFGYFPESKSPLVRIKDKLLDETGSTNTTVLTGGLDKLVDKAVNKRSLPQTVSRAAKQPDGYLYHGTNNSVIDVIAKEGLKPMRRGLLSLSKDESYSRSFADIPATKTKGAMLRVKSDVLHGKTVKGKPNRPKPDQLYEVLTKENIPPEAIEIHMGGEWRPLVEYNNAALAAKVVNKRSPQVAGKSGNNLSSPRGSTDKLRHELEALQAEKAANIEAFNLERDAYGGSQVIESFSGNQKPTTFNRDVAVMQRLAKKYGVDEAAIRDPKRSSRVAEAMISSPYGGNLTNSEDKAIYKAINLKTKKQLQSETASYNQRIKDIKNDLSKIKSHEDRIKKETAIWEKEFGRAATPQEQNRLYSEWQKALQRETITAKQKLTQDNVKVRAGNADRKRLSNDLFKNDPLRQTGAKMPSKPNVTDAGANFPAKALGQGTDKAAFSYMRETLVRNIEETFGRGSKATKQMREYLLDPILKNETNRTKMVNRIRTNLSEVMAQSKIARGSKADYAAADFIEGTLSRDQLKAQFPKQWQSIVKFADEGRAIYKDLLARTNEQLTKYGYDPIPERQNYVTHTTELGSFWDKAGSFLNFDKDKLPTQMAGIHMDTRPGKQFNPFAQQRKGGSTHEGLAKSLDSYLDVTTKQMFHTADVQRARALQTYLERQAESAGGDSTTLSNFTSYIGQYADSLAGKKSVLDRPFEKVFGRGILKAGDKLRQRFGANAVGGNLASALTNFIPLTQSFASTNKIAATKGLLSTLKGAVGDIASIDGVESSFLRRRFPEARIGTSKAIKTQEIITSPFELADKFSARTIVGGKFYEGLQKGLNPQQAMSQADEYAARIMSDRSLGQSPLLFDSKVLGAFTQFQNEVNNQVSVIFKDIPKNMGMSKKQVAASLTQVAVFSYLYNELSETLTGRRSAVDPIDYVASVIQGDIAGAGQDIMEDLPFTSILSGGRIPIGGAIPNPLDLASGKSTIRKEATKPLAYLALPYGGSQLKKSIEGVETYLKGGDTDKAGRQKFAVEGTPANAARSALFGKWSTPEARDYIENIGKPKQASKEVTPGITASDPTERLQALKEEKKRLERLPNPGFLRQGITDEQRASQITDVERQIATANLDQKFANVAVSVNPLAKGRANSQKESAIKAVYRAWLDGDIDERQVNDIFTRHNVDSQQAEYTYAKSMPVADRAPYVMDKISQGGVKIAQDLIGQKILTTSVAKEMLESGLIDQNEYAALKALISPPKAKASGSGRRRSVKVSLPKVKLSNPNLSFVTSSRVKVVAPPKFKRIAA